MATGEDSEASDWKQRYLSLDVSLHKFKDQALRIREVLGSKVEELERSQAAATERAEKAEQEVKVLEQRLMSVGWKPEDTDSRIEELECLCRDKDNLIEDLEQQLQEQKQLRSRETKVIEDKASQIREWVISRLRELELQNQQLKLERHTLFEKIEILQSRLQSLPPSLARKIHRASLQCPPSSHLSFPRTPPDENIPDVPKRPSSAIMELFRKEQEVNGATPPGDLEEEDINVIEDLHSPLDTNGNIEEDIDFEPDYQEIDENHESKYEPCKILPPRIKIERKIFHGPPTHESVISSSTGNGSDEMIHRLSRHHYEQRMVHSPPLSPPVAYTPKSPPFIPPSASAMPKTSQISPASPQIVSSSYAAYANSRSVSAIATLPRVKKDRKPQLPGNRPQYFEHKMPRRSRDSSRMVDSDGMSRSRSGSRPPTPPLHRMPSWETRLYAAANKGMKWNESGKNGLSSPQSPDDMYHDIKVPVFTNVKGRAAQIRNSPFSGDSSSDSSDNDEPGVAMITCGESEPVMTVAGPSGSKMTTSVTVMRQVNNSGATKRVASSKSISSESSDYCLPPDEVSLGGDSDHSEPEHKLLKFTAQNMKKENLQKSGYLTKLGGKVKHWKRRWFVVQQGELFYYKSQNDMSRKPQGHIVMDGQTRIIRSTEGVNTFEIATTKRTYYLISDSTSDMEQWIRVLQNVLKRMAAHMVLEQTNAKIIMRGWVTKAKNGINKKCWCALMSKYLVYYRHQTDRVPSGQINMIDARVEELERSWDSDDSDSADSPPKHTLVIWPAQEGPTYIIIPSKQEKDSWLYHLTVASGGGMGNIGTEYEQLVSKLMNADGDPGCIYWKHACLLHSKEPIKSPLTTLPSEDLQAKAVDMFKSCSLFMNVGIESPAIDYHVSLAQNILQTCLQYPELQNEIYAQLIKQTARHPVQHKHIMPSILLCGSQSWFLCDASPTSPTNSIIDLSDAKTNPSTQVFLQGWQLLAMCVALFLPKQSILWYLKAHLQRNADPRNEAGKYAVFCQRALERILQNGCRETRPSKMEVMSILLRNPYHHSLPISIPVHFMNGIYQVVSFDGSTTVHEFMLNLIKIVNVREFNQSGFALFSDDPSGKDLEHCLQNTRKICDVISQWEQLYQEGQKEGAEISKTIKLIYKNRLYFRNMIKWETDKERLLLCYQVNEDIVNGKFPLNKDLAVELTSLMAQIEYGDTQVGDGVTGPQAARHLHLVMERFYPRRYSKGATDHEMREVLERIITKWMTLRGCSTADCVRAYLTAARKWPFFGARLFSSRMKTSRETNQVWLAIHDDGVSLLEYSTMNLVTSYDKRSIVTFGGFKDDLMIVIHRPPPNRRKTEKFLFTMSKPKILEATLLMANYVNIKPRRPSFATTSEPRTPTKSSHSTSFSLPKPSVITDSATF